VKVIGKWLVATAALLMLSAASTAAQLDHSAETRAIARDFMHLQYELKDIKGAKLKHYAPDFIQHNPEIKSAVFGDLDFFAARQAREPEKYLPPEQWVNINSHLLVQGKYFAIHHRLYTNPKDPGRVFMDIWRVENGKMVEHWDIIQPVDQNPKNDNTMWSDLVASRPPPAGESEPEAVIREYVRMGLNDGNVVGAAERYIAPNFRQHSPHIPDGREGLIAYFKLRAAQPGAPTRINSVSHILADGDLVLVTRHTMTKEDPLGTMAGDLFRVQNSLIVEHWDVMQPVPTTSVNGNKMW
jgi:predicted SnoaL-like aldol condensation-catalyzing enzyme